MKRQLYGALTLWSDNISPAALRIDDRVGRFVTIVGIPSAFLLHGYVGFIFGSVKANPWWSTPDDADRVPVLGDRVGHRGA